MSQNDEKELILGNKQLVSLFFVVVALCGVFFAMGYMVRGSSLKSESNTADKTASVAPTDTVKRQQPEPPPVETSTTAAQTSEPPAETRPAQDGPAAAAPPPSTATLTDASSITTPEAGASYVQVGALARADAESTVRTLREQRLPALLAASSKEGLFRVLVGPYHQTSDIAEAKARLKTLGFSDTIVQKQ